MPPTTWTLLSLIQWTTEFFKSKGIESARLDTEVLLAHSLNLSRVQLYTQFDRPLSPVELKNFKALIERRAAREPLAYIVGKKEFYSLEFEVTPAVLIPRPETELLVEEVIKKITPLLTKEGLGEVYSPSIFDLGTGSGCIAITLAKHLPQAKIWAVDISEDALAVAKSNAIKHAVETQIDFLLLDFTLQSSRDTLHAFDLILSNPPYISSKEMETLAPELKFEPRSALQGGESGLEYYFHLLDFAKTHLVAQGYLLVEMGSSQASAIEAMAKQKGFEQIRLLFDFAGLPRVMSFQV